MVDCKHNVFVFRFHVVLHDAVIEYLNDDIVPEFDSLRLLELKKHGVPIRADFKTALEKLPLQVFFRNLSVTVGDIPVAIYESRDGVIRISVLEESGFILHRTDSGAVTVELISYTTDTSLEW